MTRIKGFALRGVFRSVKESGGSIGSLVAALPEAERAVFDRRIVASDWYPYPAFVGLVRAVDRTLGGGDLAHAREIGRQAAGRDLSATFRIISAMTSLKSDGMKTRQAACVRRGDPACEFEGRWQSTHGRLL
jgi:hypothetical protein